MKKYKRLWLLLVMSTLIILCTGCGVSEQFNAAMTKLTAQRALAKISNARSAGMSGKSSVYADKLEEAATKLTNQESGWNVVRAIKEDTYCMPWNKKSQNKKLTNGLSHADSAFSARLANDRIYQNSNSKNVTSLLSSRGAALFIFIALVVVLWVLLSLIKKPKKYKAPSPVVAVAQEKAPEMAQTKTTELLDAHRRTVKQLKKLCKEAGIEYWQLTDKYGDDDRGLTRAYNELFIAMKSDDPNAIYDVIR